MMMIVCSWVGSTMVEGMVKDNNFGTQSSIITVTFTTISVKDRVECITLMEVFMMVNGKIINGMDTAYWSNLTVENWRANGRWVVYMMMRDNTNGWMDGFIKGNSKMDKKLEVAHYQKDKWAMKLKTFN